MILCLEDPTLELKKKSYVKTKNQYNILFTSLRPYGRGPDYNLSTKSYQDLIEYARYTPPLPHPASNTVTSPRRATWSDRPVLPVTRERSGSYSEFVSAQRRLENGPHLPPRSHHHTPSTNTVPTRISRTPTERDPLVPVYARPYTNYPGSYTGSYPSSPSGGHPVHAYRASARAHYRGLEPPEPSGRAIFWKRLRRLFFVVLGFLGAYAAYRGLAWFAVISKEAGPTAKGGIRKIGSRVVNFLAGYVGVSVTL